MRRVVTFAMVLAGTFTAFGGIAPSWVPGESRECDAVDREAGLKQSSLAGTHSRCLGWPVYRLDRDPTQCVRYDQHAVYLGRPATNQQCPAHLIGRTTRSACRPAPAQRPGGRRDRQAAQGRRRGAGR